MSNAIVREEWDQTKSVLANYRALGLASSTSHSVSMKRETKAAMRARRKARAALEGQEEEVVAVGPGGLTKASVVAQLEAQAAALAAAPKPKKKLSELQFRSIHRLVTKYGDDLTAMRRDIRLNKWQRTEAQLRKDIEIYNSMFDSIENYDFAGLSDIMVNIVRKAQDKNELSAIQTGIIRRAMRKGLDPDVALALHAQGKDPFPSLNLKSQKEVEDEEGDEDDEDDEEEEEEEEYDEDDE